MLPDPKKLAERTIKFLGGPEKAREIVDREFGQMRARWDQDVSTIGRILRAHLYLEHYITEHLQKANPRLGDLDGARLSFSTKVKLLNQVDQGVKDVVPGISHLNSIRNRLAHNLSAQVTCDDSDKFLACLSFKAFRVAGAKPGESSNDPLAILEAFAIYAAHQLTTEFSEFSAASRRAFEEPN